MPAKSVIVGQFAGPHGVRGDFKLRSFTDEPADIAAYGPLLTEDGRRLTVRILREAKPGLFVARAAEIDTREDCERFSGAKLCVPRSALGPPDDEDTFYLEDLVGLRALTPDGAPAGRVKAVLNHGAGDIVELSGVPGRKGLVLLPFTKDAVPEIDLAGGTLVAVLPQEEADPPEGGDGMPASVRR